MRAMTGYCAWFFAAMILCGLWGKDALAEKQTGKSLPAVPCLRVEAKRPIVGNLTYAQVEAAAETAAVLDLFDGLMRELASNPDIRFAGANDGSASFSPPNLEGLARFLYGFRQVENHFGRSASAEYIVVTVEAELRHENARSALVQGLRQPELLERYAAVAALQRDKMQIFDTFAAPEAEEKYSPLRIQGELARTVNSLLATGGYVKLLPGFNGVWQSPKKTLAKMQALAEISPGNPLVLSALAELYMQMDKTGEASEAIDAALKNLPEQAFLHDIKGITALRQHMPALAATAFGKAIDLAPKNAAYLLHRASAHLVQGHVPAMCQDFQAACAAGDCTGYQWARERGQCGPEQGEEGSGQMEGRSQ